jgi:diguanylate cyclase (GGDEF)-like protein
MRDDIFNFSPRGWGRVIFGTLAGTLACIALALYVDSFNFPKMTPDELNRALLVDILLPTVLAVPMLLFLLSKLRDLAIAHHALQQIASTDSLTSVLNRRAFMTLVDAYLSEVRTQERKGALLVVDADNFKSINDAYGHDRGDEALRTIAAAIKGMLRNADLVGRIGGEEFAVFLPGSTPDNAERVAERIRSSVATSEFLPDGRRRDLSVSVGGAVFEKQLAFSELFRIADQQLYLAKQAGRNRISVAPVIHYDGVPMAAA